MVRPKRGVQRAEGVSEVDAFATKTRRQRQQLAADPHRPRYHFMAPANWMNDPNGIIEWKGQYHLFYQHNPQAPVWDNMHWGHAVSGDLVHWRDLPIALAPTPGGPDADGCWSGCAVDDDGVPTLLYTGVKGDWTQPHNQRVCVATSDDEMIQWRKCAANPVIAQPPPGMKIAGFRDPYVWREDGRWIMAIGAGIQDVGGAVLLYRSSDLINWEYLQPLCLGDARDRSGLWTGTVWEVPQLHSLGDKHVLLATIWDGDPLYSVYFTGDYHNYRFTPAPARKLDFGDRHFYAAHAIVDSQGRRLMWGFIGESRSSEAQQAAGWSGLMSLPRVLEMGADSQLLIKPAPEIEALRRQRRHFSDIPLSAASAEFRLEPLDRCLEVAAEIDPGSAEECGFRVCASPDRQEETTIFYDAAGKRLGVDRRRSSLLRESGVAADVQAGAFELKPGETLRLRVFVDCSVIEVYANDRACLTSRVYPSRADSRYVSLYARGQASVKSLDLWRMRSIWT